MNRMLILLGVAACLVFSTAAQGQDNPFVGTWKLNTAKSKYPAGQMPKNITRTVDADSTAAKYHSEGVSADGTKIDFSFVTKYNGAYSTIKGTGMPLGADKIAITRPSPSTTKATLKKGTTVVAHTTSTVSASGKTTILNIVPTDGSDPTKAVYDKQ
jgi:hypothetical protein